VISLQSKSNFRGRLPIKSSRYTLIDVRAGFREITMFYEMAARKRDIDVPGFKTAWDRSAIVAVKPTNKAERSAAETTAAESVERRAETKGNVDQQRTRRTQRRISVSQMLARIRAHSCRGYPRWEPYAGKLHVRIWCSEASCHSSPKLPLLKLQKSLI
jgi:hypothetical protein